MDNEPQMFVVGDRPRGRPRADEPKMRVSTWMPEQHVDEITKLANANNMSVSAFVSYIVCGYVAHRRRR